MKSEKIAKTFQRWLLLLVILGFCITVVLSWIIQTRFVITNTEALIRLNMRDVRADVVDESDKNLLNLANQVAEELNKTEDIENEMLISLAEKYRLSEINYVNNEGIIRATTHSDFLNYDMRNGEQSSEFMVLLDGEQTQVVQSYQPVSHESRIYRKYAGVTLSEGGFVQVGYDAEHFQKDIDEVINGIADNRHIGETGCVVMADKQGIIVSDRFGNEGKELSVTGFSMEKATSNELCTQKIYGKTSYCMYAESEGYIIMMAMPKDEALFSRRLSIRMFMVLSAIIFGLLFVMIYRLIKKLIVNNIDSINNSLERITDGDLNEVVNVRSNVEFAELSDSINETVDSLKGYIAEAEARIDKELEFARTIQSAALPHVFPPYPDRKEFDIYASMNAAKEVGGDFYDFYFTGMNKLAFLVADVSGKSISGAMTMMSAKTLIKGFAESGKPIDEIFTLTNERLCQDNEANMFVTTWMGIIDLQTGTVEYANAGHNPPLVRHSDDSFEYLKSSHDLVLGAMEGIEYRKNTLRLECGDTIFLYTDGITEATNFSNELYGEKRLLNILNASKMLSVKELCVAVKADADAFVGGAMQFDDMTMLCFTYKGTDLFVTKADVTLEELPALTDSIEDVFGSNDVSPAIIIKMNIALDEIFSNIVKFSSATYIRVACGFEGDMAYMRFEDDGIPYNPIEAKEADITQAAEEREIGGLGIHIVKQSMDVMEYEYVGEKNVLKVGKRG